MDTLFIPTENDFKRWIREAVSELIINNKETTLISTSEEQSLLNRKEVASFLRISLEGLITAANKFYEKI